MTNIVQKELSYAIVGAAMEVHRELGPGFLERVYENALIHELKLRGLKCEQQKHLDVVYKGVLVEHYVTDVLVEDKVILELKGVPTPIMDKHLTQSLNYIAATGLELCIILNFGRPSLEHKRVVRTRKNKFAK